MRNNDKYADADARIDFNERFQDIVLNNELLLMRELNFHLTVHNPFRPVEGLLIDVKVLYYTTTR